MIPENLKEEFFFYAVTKCLPLNKEKNIMGNFWYKCEILDLKKDQIGNPDTVSYENFKSN